MFKRFILIIALTIPFFVLADTGPKFSSSATILLYEQNKPVTHVDSICILIYNHKQFIDTATLHYTTAQFWIGYVLHKENQGYTITTHADFKPFKVIAFIKGKRCESDTLIKFNGSELFILKKQDDKLIDASPLFHQYWYKYFVSLLITLMLELFIGQRYYIKSQSKKTRINYLLTFSMVNLVTHFTLWLIYSHFNFPILFLELLVVIAESLYWSLYFNFSPRKAFLISLLTNFVSWLMGAVILSAI